MGIPLPLCWSHHLHRCGRLMDWLSQSLFDWPASREATIERCRTNANMPRPCLDRHRLSECSEQGPAMSAVGSLLLWRRPSDIAGGIGPIVVRETVDGMFLRRARSHVSEEVLERAPSLTDRNAAPAPVLEVLGVRVLASIPHVVPRAILRREAHAVGRVGQAARCYSLRSHARSSLIGAWVVRAARAFHRSCGPSHSTTANARSRSSR